MSTVQVLLLMFLALALFKGIVTTATTKDAAEKLEVVAKLIGVAAEKLEDDGYKVSAQLSSFMWRTGPILKTLGPAMSQIFAVLDSGQKTREEEIADIKEAFTTLNIRLKRMERKIETIESTIERVESTIDYRLNRDKIKEGERRFRQFLDFSEQKQAKSELKAACEDISYAPETLLNFIYGQVVDPTTQPHLFLSIIESYKYDNRKFTSWAKIVFMDALLTAKLHSICAGFKNTSSPWNHLKTDDTNRKLRHISDAIVNYQEILQSNFMLQTYDDVLEGREETDPDALRLSVHQNLAAKYDFADFSVHSFINRDDEEHFKMSGRMYGAQSGYTYVKHGAIVVWNWSHKDDRLQMVEKLQEVDRVYWTNCVACEDSDDFFRTPIRIHDCLEECLSSVDYSMLLVVKSRSRVLISSPPFTLSTYSFADYAVVSIGPNRYYHEWCSYGHCSAIVIGV